MENYLLLLAMTKGLATSQVSHETDGLNWHNFSLCRISSQSTLR